MGAEDQELSRVPFPSEDEGRIPDRVEPPTLVKAAWMAAVALLMLACALLVS